MFNTTVKLEIAEDSQLFKNMSEMVENGEGTYEQVLQSLCNWPNVQMVLCGNARAHLGMNQMGLKNLINRK